MPLEGITIVDMGHVTAGPLTSWLLQPLGAEVVKVERPGQGEGGRDVVSPSEPADGDGYYFHSKNTDKRSLSVDVKSEDGRDIVRALAREADVFVENFVPGKLDSMGLGYTDLREENESLIYCSISGFGHDSVDREQRAYDSILQALSGVMYVTGYEGDPPTKLGPSVMDNLAGYVAATSIVAALHHRSETGRGQHVDVSMQDSAAWLMQARLPFESRRTPHQPAVAPHALAGVFETADGWVTIDVRTADDLDRLAGRVADVEGHESLETAIASWAANRTTEGAIEACAEVNVSAAPVRQVNDVATDEHLDARGTFATIDCGDEERRLPVSPYRTAMRTETVSPERGGPSLGEHTDEVLVNLLDYEEEAVRELREGGVVE